MTRYVRQPNGIKACTLFRDFAWDLDETAKGNNQNALNNIARDFNSCLGTMNGVKVHLSIKEKIRRSQTQSSIGARSLFHLKLLYDPAIKSGMSAAAAEQFFAEKVKPIQ